MCLLSYADNKNAVAQIGESGKSGGRLHDFFQKIEKQKKLL